MRLDNTFSEAHLIEPFQFWPWLFESDLASTPGKTYSVELLPALRVQYPGCISDHIASVRLGALPANARAGKWCFNVVEFSPEHGRVIERCVSDVTPISQDAGDNYNYADQPADEFPEQLLQAIFRPGQAVTIGETLGIFWPETMHMLRAQVKTVADAVGFKYQNEAMVLERRLIGQAKYFRDLTVLSSKELCRNVDLATSAVQSLRLAAPHGIQGDLAKTRWEEVIAEARQCSLLREGFESDVFAAVHAAFTALPRATQIAYWLLHGPVLTDFLPGDDWLNPEQSLGQGEFYGLELALRSAVDGVWIMADVEAH